MSHATQRLAELYREGLEVYPANLRGLARSPRKGIPRAVKPAVATKFLNWVKLSHPRLYAAAERQAAKPNGLGQTSTTEPSAFDRVMNAITSLAPVYLQARAQKELLDVQMERARNNLPPLDPTQYAPAVQVSVDPAMYAPQLEAAKPWLLYGGLAIGGFLLFRMMSSRRR